MLTIRTEWPSVCGRNHLSSLFLLLCPRVHHRCDAFKMLSFSAQLSEKNLYDLLGVASDASQHDIKCAYFAKCKTLHPDTKCDGTTKSDFLELKQAYDVLKRPAERRRYDNTLLFNSKLKNDYSNKSYYYERGGQRHWQNGASTFDSFSSSSFRSVGEDFYFVSSIFLFGFVFVFLFYFAQWISIRRQNKRLALLDDGEEIANCFLRQRGVDASMANDPFQKERLTRLLKTDIEEAMKRRNENLEHRTNSMEIREENGWRTAVQSVDGSRKIR